MLYWTSPPNRLSELSIKSDMIERIYPALTDAGIRLPFPTRIIYVRTAEVADELLTRNRQKRNN